MSLNGTKVFEKALNAVKVLGWLKIFGPAQNILGPVKGQGITIIKVFVLRILLLSLRSRESLSNKILRSGCLNRIRDLGQFGNS